MPKALHNLVAAIHETPWAIYPPALQAMGSAVLADRAGEAFDWSATAQFALRSESESKMQIVGDTAVIPITGVLVPRPNVITRYYGGTATEQIEADFRAALSNEQVKRIQFFVDSPGGSAIGNEEVARTIYAGRGAKRIESIIRGICASAAYYIASAADEIIASPSSMVGSIGTILMHVEISKAWEECGPKRTVIKHGENKGDGNMVEPLSAKAKGNLQALVDGYGTQFVAAVAKHRGTSAKAVMDDFGQGRVFVAEEAKRRGLVDRVQTLAPGQSETESEADSEPIETAGRLETCPTEETQTTVAPDRPAETSAKESSTMNPKIKAALFARGLIDSMDASDEVCKAALNAWAAGRGLTLAADAKDAEVLAMLNGPAQPSQTADPPATTQTAATPAASQPAENVQAAHDREIAEARTAAAAEERERQAALRQRGQAMGIDSAAIDAAIEDGSAVEAATTTWFNQMAENETPVNQSEGGGRIEGGSASIDRFNQSAADALFSRSGYAPDDYQMVQGAADLQQAPLIHIASEALRLRGVRVAQFATPENVAMQWLQLDAQLEVFSAGPAFNRPGDFPNLLSNLAGKILDQGIQLAEATYPEWTGKLQDLPDFKPKTLIGVGTFDELDLVVDDEDPKELPLDEEAVGWIQIDRFANTIGLTPVMVANDDLDGFTQGLTSLSSAHENTLNRLCIALLTGNVTLLDTNSLFDDTNHGNDITAGSGGAPSITQADLMRQKHRAQQGIGDKGKVKTPPRIALVPSALETDAEQVFLPAPEFRPTTDATINPFRNKIKPVVEPELDDNSTTIWYTFADPRIRRVIVHAFMRGYGRGGRRTTWFDPARETRYVKLEGRMAAAAAGHRGAVRNAG